MGHRSDVALLTTKKGWKNVQAAMFEADPQQAEIYVERADFTHFSKGKYILIKLLQMKWYENDKIYPCVDAFMEAVHEFDEQGIPYYYARIGEDYDDNEFDLGAACYREEFDDMPVLEVESVFSIFERG